MSAPAHLTPYDARKIKASAIAAVLVVTEAGSSAWVVGAIEQAAPNAIYITDFWAGPFGPGVFAAIRDVLKARFADCRCNNGGVLLSREDLVQDAMDVFYDPEVALNVAPIPAEFKPEEHMVAVAARGHARLVRVTGEVTEQALRSPLGGALDLRAGGNTNDPMRQAVILLVALSLGW